MSFVTPPVSYKSGHVQVLVYGKAVMGMDHTAAKLVDVKGGYFMKSGVRENEDTCTLAVTIGTHDTVGRRCNVLKRPSLPLFYCSGLCSPTCDRTQNECPVNSHPCQCVVFKE